MARLTRARPWLGTLVEIEVRHARAEAPALRAVERAFAAIARVHRLMSPLEPGGDLGRLHAAAPGRWVSVEAETAAVLRAARRFYRASAGAFDPVAGGGGTMDDLEIRGRRVRRRREVRVDLGGIAKGHAVDRACAVLRRCPSISSGIVNAGGDLRCFGAPARLVHVRAPGTRMPAYALRVRNAALATSAPALAPGPLRGLVDPRSARPYRGRASATVGARTAIAADALAKVALFAAPALRDRVLRSYGASLFLQSEAKKKPAPGEGAGLRAKRTGQSE